MGITTGATSFYRLLWLGASMTLAVIVSGQERGDAVLNPSTMPKIGTVSSRYLSYNIEMVEVTGGRFWAPYKSSADVDHQNNSPSAANEPVGGMSSLYEYRPPIDLSNPRLQKLAKALGPAYIRVSGSWANSTYFQDNQSPPPKEPPKGFRNVLTRAEWKGVVDFARAVDAKIVTSVAVSPGVRDASGAWQPNQAKALFDYTKA